MMNRGLKLRRNDEMIVTENTVELLKTDIFVLWFGAPSDVKNEV